MRVFLILALVCCVPLEGVTTNHRAWVSAWKELNKRGIDRNELALASILEKTLSTDSITSKTEDEILQDPTTNPDEIIKAAENAMTDLHRLSAVQSVQQDTQECCAAHRIGSLDDLSNQATAVLKRLSAAPLTNVLDQNDEDYLSGKHAREHAGKRALWNRVMGGKGKWGKGGGGKDSGSGKDGKMPAKQRKLKLHPVEIVGETVEADTPDGAGSGSPNGGRGVDSPSPSSAASSSSQTSAAAAGGDESNVSPSVTELKAKIAALIVKIREHSQSPQGLMQSVAEGKELMKLYKQVKSATEVELLKYTINPADMGPFPIEADDVVDSPLNQDAASWGMSGGIVADWISPFAGQGGQNEYNANICCDLNGGRGGGGDIENPETIPTSSSGAATGTATPTTPSSSAAPLPADVSSSAAAAAAVMSSSSAAAEGGLIQTQINAAANAAAGAGAGADPNNIPGLGQVRVYRLFPGPREKVAPGDVPGMPNLMTLPADVIPPEGRPLPPLNNDVSSDGLLHGVRFQAQQGQAQQAQAQTQQQQAATTTTTTTTTQAAAAAAPATPAAAATSPSPAAVASNIPSGMITPAIDPNLHLTPDQLQRIMGSNTPAGMIHPALSPVPLSPGMVPASYADALLQQHEQLGGGGELTAAQLWSLIRDQDQRRLNPQPATPAPQMTPAQMLKLELDMLRQQMQQH